MELNSRVLAITVNESKEKEFGTSYSEKNNNADSTYFKDCFDKIKKDFEKNFIPNDIYNSMLYHYTNEVAFLKIVASQKFRASNVNYLDDRFEYDYGIRLAIEVLKNNNYCEGFSEFIYGQILRLYTQRFNFFIISTSLDPNNDYLWDNYAGNNGFCIGINSDMLLAEIDFLPVQFDNSEDLIQYDNFIGKVIYEKEMQKGIITEYFGRLNDCWNESKGVACEIRAGFLFPNLSNCLLLFKTDKYKDEKEIRIIIDTFDNDKIIYDDSRKCIYLNFVERGNVPLKKIIIDYGTKKFNIKQLDLLWFLRKINMILIKSKEHSYISFTFHKRYGCMNHNQFKFMKILFQKFLLTSRHLLNNMIRFFQLNI